MGQCPKSVMFFGYYLDESDFDPGDLDEDFLDDGVEVESFGYEYQDRIVAMEGTLQNVYDWGPTEIRLPNTPSAEKIREFQSACALHGVPVLASLKPRWIVANSYG